MGLLLRGAASQAGLHALGKSDQTHLCLLFLGKVSLCVMGDTLESNYMQVDSNGTKPLENDRAAGALRASVFPGCVQKTLQQIVSIGIIR